MRFNQIFRSSVGKKSLMAVTGLLLFGFVAAHMLGNLQIFLGQEAINSYALHLQELQILLWPARAVLLTALVLHIWAAVTLSAENRRARGGMLRYRHEDTVQASYASRTMLLSGVIIFLFIVYHLLHFTFGATNPDLYHLVDAKGRHDVYSMSVLSFQNPYISSVYILAMAVLCFHLSHGVFSLFQSLGLNNEEATPKLRLTANAVSLLIFLGNASMPLAVLFGLLKPAGSF